MARGAVFCLSRQRVSGRKTSCSNAKGDRRASGWREAFRFAPGVSECTWGLDMISLKCGSSYMSFHPCFHFPVPLLSHSSHEGTWSSSPRRTVSKVLLFALPQILFLHSSPPSSSLSLSSSSAPAWVKDPYSGFPKNPEQTSLITFSTLD